MKKRMLYIMLATVCAASVILSGCSLFGKKEVEPTYELKGYSVEELQADTYYVKSGEYYYPIAPGELTVENDGEAIAKEANDERVVWYTLDDCMIPTMYADDSLVYVSSEGIPSSFVWERFEDEGYTVGVKGLKILESGKYSTLNSAVNINAKSSAAAGLADIAADSEILIDKVGTEQLTEDNVSRAGSVTGLSYNKSYTVDFYTGTNYIPREVVADTHVFCSFELFETANYAFDNAGYIKIEVPEYFISGYYYINGVGLIKYVDNPKATGIVNIDFNEPYFLGTDEDGNVITIDTLKAEYPEDVVDEENPVEEKVYTNKITVDCTQESMAVTISYSDIFPEILEEKEAAKAAAAAETKKDVAPGMEAVEEVEILPTATITDPEGQEYEFETDIRQENALTYTAQLPLSGEWIVAIKGVDNRTFDVNTVFVSGHSDSMVHAGKGKAVMEAYIKQPMNDGVIKFTWENAERAANILVKTPDDISYGKDVNAEDVLSEGYGEMEIALGPMIEGLYTFEISGEDLGRVRYSCFDNASSLVEEPEEDVPADGESVEEDEDALLTEEEEYY